LNTSPVSSSAASRCRSLRFSARPKGFAGLFGAAPSVALAMLGLTIMEHDAPYAAEEGRAMVFGAVALMAYSIIVCQLLLRTGIGALQATALAFVVRLFVAFGLYSLTGGS
jgi:hypothetical protein